MKKVEISIFLNEQSTVMFGRTGRELMIIACGIAVGYNAWSTISLAGGFSSTIVHVFLTALPIALSCVVALTSIAGRPLEEWGFVLLLYLFVPKRYQYVPFDPEEQGQKGQSLSIRKLVMNALTNNEDEGQDD